MDRPLDDVISDRQGRRTRGGRPRRQDRWMRDDSRKMNGRSESTNPDIDWIHDKYEDEPQSRRPYRGGRYSRIDRYSPEREVMPAGARLRVDNLHYDLTEDDLEELFNRIGPVQTLSIRFDRAGRSSGTAFVTYESLLDARQAVRSFDGANANGQPIRLTLMPSGPSASSADIGIRGRAGGAAPRNPFDTAVKPGRSLFERIEEPDRSRGGSGRRSRSRSPGALRRTNISKPPPEGVDRYVPSGNSSSRRRRSRTRSPPRGRRSPVGGSRGRRDNRDRDGGGRPVVNGRPRKTQEELDKEMEDYWGGSKDQAPQAGNGIVQNGTLGAADAAVAEVTMDDGDIDMIE